jgi:hypothetical protein
MPEKPMPFVITDRRKFNAEGEARPDADPSPDREPRNDGPPTPPAPDLQPKPADKPVSSPDPENVNITPDKPEPETVASAEQINAEQDLDQDLPPAPTPEQMEQSRIAFQATADRLDIAVRAANPGADHPPAMTFDQLVQSIYMQAILQLGGGTQEGQQPQVDILGARQSIDMLGILHEKTSGNLSQAEDVLLASALFETRIGFLEITQALARSAQQRAAAGGAPMPPPPGAGPRIVR